MIVAKICFILSWRKFYVISCYVIRLCHAMTLKSCWVTTVMTCCNTVSIVMTMLSIVMISPCYIVWCDAHPITCPPSVGFHRLWQRAKRKYINSTTSTTCHLISLFVGLFVCLLDCAYLYDCLNGEIYVFVCDIVPRDNSTTLGQPPGPKHQFF